MYDAGPGPSEYHYHGCVSGSRVDLATALLRNGQLDAAATAIRAVLSLPSNRRTASLVQRFDRVRAELAALRYWGQADAAELDENIEAFSAETIVGDLGELPTASH